MMKNVQVVTAIVVLATGVVLSYISFFYPPRGEIATSVLHYFAQTLMFAGSVFGLKTYIDRRSTK